MTKPSEFDPKSSDLINSSNWIHHLLSQTKTDLPIKYTFYTTETLPRLPQHERMR